VLGAWSRRQLLAGTGAAAAGAVAVQAVLGARPAYAGTDGDVVLGASNTEAATTQISSTTDGSDGLQVFAVGGGNAIYGQSDTAIGLSGVIAPGGNGRDRTHAEETALTLTPRSSHPSLPRNKGHRTASYGFAPDGASNCNWRARSSHILSSSTLVCSL
jgi:hypothetical protein